MNYKDNWEEKIKDVLTLECDGITASQDLKDRIDERILGSRKEAGNMKKLSVKKMVIGVAVGCLLVSGGVFAAGHATSLVSHSWLTDAYRSYSDMDKAQQELGYAVDSVEQFTNGYRFERMSVDDVQGMDEQGHEVYTFKNMNIHYTKGGEPSISLYIEKPVEKPEYTKAAAATRVCGDVTLHYSTTTFKFVPPDYELTEEDKANEKRDDYSISVGSSKVEIQQSSDVIWEKNGVQYHLLGFDLNLDADEMFDMAEEIMGTK